MFLFGGATQYTVYGGVIFTPQNDKSPESGLLGMSVGVVDVSLTFDS